MIIKSAAIAIKLVYTTARIGATANIIDKAVIVVKAKIINENTCVKAPNPTAIPAKHPTNSINNTISPNLFFSKYSKDNFSPIFFDSATFDIVL